MHIHELYNLISHQQYLMHKNQKLRLIQQICFLLDFSQPAVSTVLQYYRKFEPHVPNNQYSNQVIVCSCIFLVSKIFEDQRKIRDILNVINSAIKLYQLASTSETHESQSNYISLSTLISSSNTNKDTLMSQIQPTYDLSMYAQLKKQVLEAEQVLLKILGFNFSIAEQKLSNYRQLIGVCDQLRLPANVIQMAVAVYNDLEFSDILQWVPGIIYFTIQVREVQEHPTTEVEQAQQQLMTIEWQKLFLVSIKKLECYCDRILKYYETVSKEEFQQCESDVENGCSNG